MVDETDVTDEEQDDADDTEQDDPKEDSEDSSEGDSDDELDPEVAKMLDDIDSLEEDEPSEEEDDDPDMESEDLEEDVDTDKVEDDDEQKNLLDDLLEQDKENNKEDEPETSEDDTVTDDMIVAAMATTKDWGQYLSNAREEGIQVNERFVADAARAGLSPDFLGERGISDIGSMTAYLIEMEKRADPEAVLVPAKDDEENWEAFETDVLGIPKESADYDDDIFDQTWLSEKGMEDEQGRVREWLHKMKVDQNQAYMVVDQMQKDRELHQEQQAADLKSYRIAQEGELKEEFGDDYREIMKDVAGFLSKHGGEFIKEFKGTAPFYSRALAKMIYNAMNDLESPETVNFSRFSKGLTGYSDQKLKATFDALVKSKFVDEKYATHPSKKVRQEYKKYVVRLRSIEKELERRGFDNFNEIE